MLFNKNIDPNAGRLLVRDSVNKLVIVEFTTSSEGM